MYTGRGVHGMSPGRRIYDRPLTQLFDCSVAVGRAKVVLAEVDSLWYPMVEADYRVLPVAYVVSKAYIEDNISKVEAVEEEPKGVNNAVAFVDNNQHCWRSTPTTSNVLCLHSPSSTSEVRRDGCMSIIILGYELVALGCLNR